MATLYWPFSTSTVTEWPGQRPGSYHIGTDFGIGQGTPLRATVDGRVSRWTDQYGAYIVDIIADDGLLVRNGHLSRIDVSNGQRVTAGQQIGLTGGAPGTPGAGWSTGPHLHWELRRGSAWIDPRNLNPQPLNFGDNPQTESDSDMKVITGGTVALVGEYETTIYTSMAGGQGFSIEANSKAYGNVGGLTNDQVMTLVNEAKGRRDNLIRSIVSQIQPIIAAEVAKAVQSLPGGSAQIDYDRIADAVLDAQARRLAE